MPLRINWIRTTLVSQFSSFQTEVNEHFKKWGIISKAFLWSTAPLIVSCDNFVKHTHPYMFKDNGIIEMNGFVNLSVCKFNLYTTTTMRTVREIKFESMIETAHYYI